MLMNVFSTASLLAIAEIIIRWSQEKNHQHSIEEWTYILCGETIAEIERDNCYAKVIILSDRIDYLRLIYHVHNYEPLLFSNCPLE